MNRLKIARKRREWRNFSAHLKRVEIHIYRSSPFRLFPAMAIVARSCPGRKGRSPKGSSALSFSSARALFASGPKFFISLTGCEAVFFWYEILPDFLL